jgi:hypothetical protein
MTLTSCKIHFTKQASRSIYASSSLLKQLNLKPTKSIQLRLGKKVTRTALKRIKKPGKHLYIPSTIRSLIHFPQTGSVYISNQDNEKIELGPLIGIMTTADQRTDARPFGRKSGLIKSYLQAGNGKAFYFAFSPGDINWHNETVAAHFLNSKGGWTRKIVPLPDVVYNRVTNRRIERSPAMQALKERFVRRNIPIFNWNFYDKWQIYNILQNEPEVSRYVPESYIDPSPEQIRKMLEKHKFVYLKPTAGSLGKGIYRITHLPGRGYYVRYRNAGRNILLRFSRFSRLMDLINKRKGKKLRNHVIQQGIRLIELDNCPIDFRLHLNKNGNNEWVVAGFGAKKAGKGSVTTHVRSGGQLMTPESVLKRLFSESQATEYLNKMKQTSIKLAEALERNDPHLIGEIGFDIGIDKNGDIWMFEANSKPGRSIFKHPALKPQGKASLAYIFEYCLYLSRFFRGRRIE